MEYHSKIRWIPLLINFKSNLSNYILKLKKLQLTSLEMLLCVLQKSKNKKYGENLAYLAYKKRPKGVSKLRSIQFVANLELYIVSKVATHKIHSLLNNFKDHI
jgi:hypothetical protein